MAAVPPREREAFDRHWAGILSDRGIVKQTVQVDGEVAGYICCFRKGGLDQVGYWLGRRFWGGGVATRALEQFLAQLARRRPLHAHVAKGNPASARVLEKCGFVRCGDHTGADGVEETVFRLR